MPFIETDNRNYNSRCSNVYLREYHMNTAINKHTEKHHLIYQQRNIKNTP